MIIFKKIIFTNFLSKFSYMATNVFFHVTRIKCRVTPISGRCHFDSAFRHQRRMTRMKMTSCPAYARAASAPPCPRRCSKGWKKNLPSHSLYVRSTPRGACMYCTKPVLLTRQSVVNTGVWYNTYFHLVPCIHAKQEWLRFREAKIFDRKFVTILLGKFFFSRRYSIPKFGIIVLEVRSLIFSHLQLLFGIWMHTQILNNSLTVSERPSNIIVYVHVVNIVSS